VANPNVAVVREFLAAIDAWDFDGMRERLHPTDFKYTLPYRPDWVPAELEGRETYLDFARQWSEAIEGGENLHEISVHALEDDPDTVVAFYKNEMTIVASGYHYKNDLVCTFTLRDGLIARFDERLDAIPLVLATGGSVSPTAASQS
jgi:ketosteroid isomerase-like protein